MKSFQPKEDSAPPDDDGGPDNPSANSPDEATDRPEQVTAQIYRPDCQNRNAEVDFRGEKRSNATHALTSDPDAQLFKKSPSIGAMLCFMGGGGSENGLGGLLKKSFQDDAEIGRIVRISMNFTGNSSVAAASFLRFIALAVSRACIFMF